MKHRPPRPEVDFSTWPTYDPAALSSAERKIFTARKKAVELYCANFTIQEIENQTGVNRRQVYRLIAACTQVHSDGRVYGYRALKPYVRIALYQRQTKPKRNPTGSAFGGAVGAFGYLLERYPTLQAWLTEKVTGKAIAIDQQGTSVRLRGLIKLHEDFLVQCRKEGLTVADYPMNTDLQGKRALSAWVKKICLARFAKGSRMAGAHHLKGMPALGGEHIGPVGGALEVVEFDGHRLDIRLHIVVRDPIGFEQRFEIERIWLLVIIDVWSRAVLGYHLSLNREYSRYDVIRTIEKALEPHRDRPFSLPGLTYGPRGGFPSGKYPELAYATWQRLKLDNAKANLSEDVRFALTEFVGCTVDAGPSYTPDDRPYIERFFGTVAATLSSRMPGYTGSNAHDVRRALADPKKTVQLFVTLDELEELLEASIASYNATPHSGLNGRTPLEAIEYSLRVKGKLLNWLPEGKRNTMCLMQTPKLVKVRGYLQQGQRPHVNFFGIRYTNALLASSGAFIGKMLKVYYNSQDLRCIRAFTSDGSELGELKAQGAWGEVQHDLKLRQEILKLRGRKRGDSALHHQWLSEFIDQKFSKAKKSRRAASDLARTVQTLTKEPSRPAPMDPKKQSDAEKNSAPAPSTRSQKVQVVEPRILTIGSGFSGSL